MSSLPFQLKSPAKFVKPKFPGALFAGYFPRVFASSASICGRSAGDRGDDEHAVSLAKLIGISTEEADVFLVDVNVHEAAHLSVIVAQMLVDRGEALLDFAEQIRQRLRTAFEYLHAV